MVGWVGLGGVGLGGVGWGGEGEFANELKATSKLTTVSKFPGMFQKRECCVIFASNLEQTRKKNFILLTDPNV